MMSDEPKENPEDGARLAPQPCSLRVLARDISGLVIKFKKGEVAKATEYAPGRYRLENDRGDTLTAVTEDCLRPANAEDRHRAQPTVEDYGEAEDPDGL